MITLGHREASHRARRWVPASPDLPCTPDRGRTGQVDKLLADLVRGFQDSEVFARHLPADVLSQLATASCSA